MSNLCDQLEELQEMVRVLATDVRNLRDQLGALSPAAGTSAAEYEARRSYARAVFALTEAIVEKHKMILLSLNGGRKLTLAPGVAEVLSELTFFVRDNGSVGQKDKFLKFESKLRAVYRAAGEAFGEPLSVDYGGSTGWIDFQASLLIRHRITHPKNYVELRIECEEVETIRRAEAWFRDLSNEFVRVAQEHRKKAGW